MVSGRKVYDSDVEEIRRLKLEGKLTISQIADKVGVSNRTVERHAQDIPSSDPHGGARKYSNKEIAEYYGIKEENVTPKVREDYAESRPHRRAKHSLSTSEYRARKLAATTAESSLPAFKAEIEGLFHASKIRPGEFNVDHIIRLVDGGLHHPENLQLLSLELHKLKSTLERAGRLEDAAKIGSFNEHNLAPNVRELLAENVLEKKWGKKGLMNFLGDSYQKVKPGLKFAGKTLLRAAPLAGTSLGVKAADDYRRSGNNRLAAAAAMSAVPGPIGWLGLGAEMGGLLWNKVTEDPNFLHLGPLDKRRQEWTYTGSGRRRN